MQEYNKSMQRTTELPPMAELVAEIKSVDGWVERVNLAGPEIRGFVSARMPIAGVLAPMFEYSGKYLATICETIAEADFDPTIWVARIKPGIFVCMGNVAVNQSMTSLGFHHIQAEVVIATPEQVMQVQAGYLDTAQVGNPHGDPDRRVALADFERFMQRTVQGAMILAA
jgi:hypothetical protein